MDELIPFFPGSRKFTKVKRDFKHRAPGQDRRRISLNRTYIDTKAQLGLNHFSVSVLAHEVSLLTCCVCLFGDPLECSFPSTEEKKKDFRLEQSKGWTSC